MAESHVIEQGGDILCSMSKNWWAFILRGVLALVLAVLAFLMPVEALLALTLVYGVFSLIDGGFSLIAAVRKIRRDRRWGWLAFRGVVGIITGIVVLVVPFVATWVLAIFLWVSIAVWAALVGGFELVTAWRLRKEVRGEIWLMLSGLLSLTLSGVAVWLLFARPAEAFLAMGWVIGAYATFLGVFLVLLGMRLRRNKIECKAEDTDAISGANA
ncbi:HdeD family acid-resistance protein [Marinobacter sp.]|uniref:HdeD family acid-resistance protein n=1 Tax=Marinobacter sp. TaxID=50741 RepID=UPI001B4939B9|nr:DUF308 domain-containing protein [Marinobacter sp.]MBQ0834135.1 DUF308 domain-containing protein [Marinobacter sp.]